MNILSRIIRMKVISKLLTNALVIYTSIIGLSSTALAQTSTDRSIVVMARGLSGNEHINLNVGGETVTGWSLSKVKKEYVYTGNSAGDISIEYTNDGSGMDVILDYIHVNGETRQAEDMDYNTATYANDTCGGGTRSEVMHCSGVIGFGRTDDCFSGLCSPKETTPPKTLNAPSGIGGTGSNSIIVWMKGIKGTEVVSLEVSGKKVAQWTLSTVMKGYDATTDYTGEIRLVYSNDGDNMDVQVDFLSINSEIRQAEEQAENSGYFVNDACGGGGFSEMMHCSGAINFGSISSSSLGSGGDTPTCNWYGNHYPLCVRVKNGWGWERHTSCIGANTCNIQ